jgi:hypothetical protein
VKTVLDIPDDLASELQRHAQRSGRDTADHLLHLVRLAMLVEDLPVAEIRRLAGTLRTLVEARNRAAQPSGAAPIQTDPATGLPVIISPADAPIRSMSVEDVLALEQSVLDEEDLQRAGIPL